MKTLIALAMACSLGVATNIAAEQNGPCPCCEADCTCTVCACCECAE